MTLEPAYWLLGALMMAAGALNLSAAAANATTPRRARPLRGSFWLLLGALFMAAPVLAPAWIGGCVVALSALAFAARSERMDDTQAKASEAQAAETSLRLGAKLLHPALLLPVLTCAGTLLLRYVHGQGAPFAAFALNDAPLYALASAALLSLGFACARLRTAPHRALSHGANTLDQLGWPVLLPLLLAILGALYVKAGVGDALAVHLKAIFPTDNRYACVLLFGGAMAAFTMLLGNAFAAFPVVMAAVGIPLVVKLHHGEPLSLAAIGMLCGYCGTLMTPLAANFNWVPVILLDIENRYAVIRAQLPSALLILAGNLVLLMLVVYR
jgi:uncharacterized membrane protein